MLIGEKTTDQICAGLPSQLKIATTRGNVLLQYKIHQGHVLMSMALLSVLLILSSQLSRCTFRGVKDHGASRCIVGFISIQAMGSKRRATVWNVF